MQESVQQQSRRVLELPQVLDMVARHAWWEGSRQRVLALQPLPTLEDVRARQAEVAEAMTLEERMQTPPTRGMRDVDAEAEGAARGESLDPSRLLDVAQSLQVAVKVRRFFAERGDELPHMTRLAMQLVPLGALIERIHLAIMTESAAGAGRESQVKDTASHKLGDLRVQMRTVQNRIDSRMQGILKNASYHKMFQEPYVTTRNERYVVPIKSEYRGQFPGLVLDASASGATVFMEPLAILDLGNELRRLRAAETHEIERILHELSAAVGAVRDDVVANGELLARLDGLMAIARFGTSVRGRLVEVDQRQRMVLRGARHPLLGERAVPIDVELGEGIGILIITGPNTGGKTVTLKTMGLFTLMAMCGLPLPVADGSRLGFFDGVYADIGDEQDIQQNLSTFSSHMLQVSRILDAVGERSLVLLDEAGASTDPREGTALAISILEHLHQRGALVVTTTHYSELKAFAASYEGAANAAMEFDPETLQPTYRILTGLPGRSCALDISQRLGVPMSVLSRARELLGGAHFSVENLLTDLENEREEAARRSQQARQSQNEIEVMQQKLREELRTLEELRAEERAKGAEEAHRVVRNAEKEARQMLREARDAIAELKDEMMRQHEAALAAAGAAAGAVPEQPADDGNAAARLDELEASTRERLREQANELREQAASERDDIERARAEKEAVAARPWPEEKDLGPLKNGDDVYIQHLQQEGTVVEIGHGDKVQVKIGPMRMKLERAQVRKIPPKKRADERGDGWEYSGKPTTRVSRVADVSLRLDLRGKRAEEAGYLLTEYLDQVAPMHVGPVTIVHGKGTGVLLNVVKETLKAHPSVESFRLGEAGEGDWGVTVVTLK